MPAGDVFFVAVFILAFAAFALALGWADRRTRHLGH